MEREQIIKALGCCVIGDCYPCQYRETVNCRDIMCGDALLLIKELTEENERLKGRNEHLTESLDIEDKYKERLRGILLQFTDTVHKWGNKNGYDTSEIALVPIIYEANTIKSQIEADSVRKMQERLKAQKFTHKNFGELVYVEDIDKIAKEMLEGL